MKLFKNLLLIVAGMLLVSTVTAGPAFMTQTLKMIFTNGITVSGGAVDLSAADSITLGSVELTSGTINLANGETIANSTDDTFTLGREDAGTVTVTAADDDATAALTILPGGAAAFVLGGASTTSVTVTTDSTGNGEVVLPNASVAGAELMGSTLRVAYCGQNDENGTIFVGSPALTAAEPVLADATCDGLDDATEGTADVVLSAGLALYAKYMRCTTNGTLGSGETAVYQLRDDTADVTGATCTISEAETECEVAVPTAAVIAAGSAIAVEIVETSNNADDDSKCVVLYQVQ